MIRYIRNLLLIALLAYSNLFAQEPDADGSLVKWMTVDEAMEKVKKEPRPIIMDFYTDWCGWCKKMMKSTYANKDLAQYINTYFYPVKFNAEGKDTVEFLGVKYAPTSSQPRTPHPLAVKLLKDKLMYPTTLFMNGYDKDKNEFKMNMIASGYLEEQKIEPILIFTLENAGRNASYDEFKEQFEKTYFDSTTMIKQKDVPWLNPTQAFTADTTPSKKKTLVMINSQWCNSCKVMKLTSFIDTMLEKYLVDKYTLVDFDPNITDTVNFKGKKYINPRDPQFPFHQLAVLLGRNSVSFPSLIVLDENHEILDVIPSYISPHFLKDIIHYYGENIYKKKSWQDYMKDLMAKKAG